MGIKSKSKELMTAAGVPVVPGYHGSQAANDINLLKQEALKYSNLPPYIYHVSSFKGFDFFSVWSF